MSKIVWENGKPKLYIHRDELVVPPSENELDRQSDNKLETCGVQGQLYADTCEDCKRRVIRHCRECKQALSGCSCTLGPKLEAIREDLHKRLLS